jgi:hypothetical protein
MDLKNQVPSGGFLERTPLAFVVVTVSILGVIVLGWAVIVTSSNQNTAAQQVMSAVLPMLATWVGTILAFYFGKENFEAANQSVRDLVKQVTSQQKLESIAVSKVMIKFADMHKANIKAGTEDQFPLVKLLTDLAQAAKGRRVPVLDENDHPRFVVHRSAIDEFLTKKMETLTTDQVKQLTLSDLLDDKIGYSLEAGLAVIKESDTLARAKEEMDKPQYCQDVFVTKGGTKNEPVIGWVTNVIIEDNSKV